MRRTPLALALLVPSILAALGSPPLLAQDESPGLGLEIHEDLPYAQRGELSLGLDLVRQPRIFQPHPVLLVLHGGRWSEGSPADVRGMLERAAAAGYVTVAPRYRLAPEHPWPAQWEDVRDALLWIRAHAREYQMDPERVGAVGFAAGGHLALMAGLRQASGHRPLVRTVVEFFGPANLAAEGFSPTAQGILQNLMGGPRESMAAAYADASPQSWIQPGDASVLTFHGDADALLPIAQSRDLHAALEDARVPHRLVEMPGVGHSVDEIPEACYEQAMLHLQLELVDPVFPPLACDFEGPAEQDRLHFTDPEAWEFRPAAPPEGMEIDPRGQGEPRDQGVLSLVRKASSYRPPVRSPLHQALIEGSDVRGFVLDVWVQTTHEDYGHRDLCLFFGHQDPSHFYYVHLGQSADPHAHSIFKVDGAPRVSIATERTEGTPWDFHWHRVRVTRVIDTGSIEVYFDDLETPIMKAVDKTFVHGKVGLGSFDDTGNFDALRLWGTFVR